VADAIRLASRLGLRVRVAGAGHSFNDAVCTSDMLLVLDRMQAVLRVDAVRGEVRVQAGCTLGQLSLELRRHGLALPNLGDIDRQTIAGAVCTATHGTGIRLSSLAEDVTELELVDSQSKLRIASAESDEDLFRAAKVSLGALGVITVLTLRCRPRFRLRRVERPQPVEQALEEMSQQVHAHEHFEAFVFPYADTALVRWADRTDAPPDPRRPLRDWLQEVLIANYMFEVVLMAGRAMPAAVSPLDRLAAAAASPSERVQESHRALASRRLMRFVEMEWLLPVDAAQAAIRAIRDLISARRLKVNMPIELRFVAADRAFLSPAYGRDSCAVAVHAYRGMAWQPYFRAVERVMWELGGRPHWGKLHFQTFQTLRQRYPAWDDFQSARSRFDARGRFRNAYTDRVLGLPG
jgi:L-gulono-1,4-lactone dehydrogenase